ncbi:hypothetical protein QOT17_022678 [Balamuthia mandrillaris]
MLQQTGSMAHGIACGRRFWKSCNSTVVELFPPTLWMMTKPLQGSSKYKWRTTPLPPYALSMLPSTSFGSNTTQDETLELQNHLADVLAQSTADVELSNKRPTSGAFGIPIASAEDVQLNDRQPTPRSSSQPPATTQDLEASHK